MKILCVAESIGKTHDFKLYKDSVGHRMLSTIKAQADSAYQGITMYHLNSETPKKKPKGAVSLLPKKKLKTNIFPVNEFILNTSMRKSKSLKL